MNFKYTEIMDYIKAEIEKGTYKNKLPSIRGLAIRFNCSNSTVIKAYSELEEQGLIYPAPKSGYYINHNKSDNTNEYDFYSGIPLSSYLPFDSIEKAYSSSFKDNNISIINYSFSRGYQKLREYLSNPYGIKVDPDRVFILSGTQNMINLIIAMAQRLNEEILIEDPTYNLLSGALLAYGKKVSFVNRTLNGLDIDTIEEYAKQGKFKYFMTMSRNHNPLGTNLTNAEMDKLISLANEYDFYIIDDDYIHELSGDNTLFARDPERVLHLRSFSKTISPSLRLCSLIVPEKLKEPIIKTNIYMNTGASLISQDVLLRYLTSDAYERNSKLLKERSEEKCRLLEDILSHNCPFRYNVPQAGLYAYIEMPKNFKTMELLENLDSKGYRFRSDVEFSINKEIRGLRISLSRVEKKQIEKGIYELLSEINLLMNERERPSKEIYI